MKPADARILTINGGSSSIKFALFEAGDSLQRILAESKTSMHGEGDSGYAYGMWPVVAFVPRLCKEAVA